MTKDEALEMACQALIRTDRISGYPNNAEVIFAIKEALAQPEQERPAPCARHCEATAFQITIKNLEAQLAQPKQEPVAVVDSTISGHIDWLCTFFPKQGTKLYTTPPQRKPLTDEQIMANDVLRYHFALNGGAGPISKQGRKVIDAIEAAHGIKGEP